MRYEPKKLVWQYKSLVCIFIDFYTKTACDKIYDFLKTPWITRVYHGEKSGSIKALVF